MGKWLLVIAVVALGYFWWCQQRLQRRPPQRPSAASPPRVTPPAPAPMTRCRHCGVHLPAADAAHGALGPYCCDEHRRLAEG